MRAADLGQRGNEGRADETRGQVGRLLKVLFAPIRTETPRQAERHVC